MVNKKQWRKRVPGRPRFNRVVLRVRRFIRMPQRTTLTDASKWMGIDRKTLEDWLVKNDGYNLVTEKQQNGWVYVYKDRLIPWLIDTGHLSQDARDQLIP